MTDFPPALSDFPRTRLAATLEKVTAAHLLLPVTLPAAALAGFVLGHRPRRMGPSTQYPQLTAEGLGAAFQYAAQALKGEQTWELTITA